MDRMQATQRRFPMVGGLADFLAAGTSPQRTQQMRGLMEFLQVPDIAATLDRVSYGEPLTTGRGMTTKLRPETENTLMAALGMIPAGRPAEAGAMALGRAGERYAERVVPQVMERGGLPAEMLSAMAQGTQSPATVFHGTPHLFNKFDSSKIGTGEGAQAFGHGLYLAENPGVAKDYQQKLSSAGSAKNLASQFGGIDEGLAEAQRRVDRYKEMVAKGDGNSERAKSFLRISEKNLQDLQAMKQGLPENTGYLYQVDLPDEQIARMMDWDKPISQQPKSVQEAVRPIIEQTAKSFPSVRDNQQLTGYGLYKAYQGHRGGNPVAASESLRDAGIPGIRYLDESSRDIKPVWVVENKGFGAWDFPSKTDAEDFMRNNPQLKTNLIAPQKTTSNFVVFPGMEDMLRIEQINNQPVESLFRSLGR